MRIGATSPDKVCGGDGMIAVMLHVDKDGFMHMLEIIKYDGFRDY